MKKETTDYRLADLITKAAYMHKELTEKKEEFQKIKDEITKLAIIPQGKMSTQINANGITCKVQCTERLSWDQQKLCQARAKIGDEIFMQAFVYEWKPRSKKDLDGFMSCAPEEHKNLIYDAVTATRGFTLSFPKKEDKNV